MGHVGKTDFRSPVIFLEQRRIPGTTNHLSLLTSHLSRILALSLAASLIDDLL